jgi:hypothetical protein
MADDLEEVKAEFIAALREAASAVRGTSDAYEESQSEEIKQTRALNEELEKLGLTIKKDEGLVSTQAERTKERIRLEQEVNQQLKDSGKVRQEASAAEIEEYKLTQKRNVLYDSELASLGRMIDQNGKLVKTTVELEGAQKKQIAAIKREEEKRREGEAAVEDLNKAFGQLPGKLGMLALTTAFDFLKASVVGSYKAMIATEDALLSGQRGLSVQTAATAAKMQEMAKATAKLGSNLSGMGDQFLTMSFGVMAVNLPLGLLALAVGGLLKVLGMAGEAEAATMERKAEMEKKRGEINDKYAEGFRKLGEASIAGADGMSGLRANMYNLTLTVADIDKYSKVLQDNQKNLVLIGGTMTEGVKSFSNVAADLIKSSLGKTLEAMGIGVEEQMAHTAQFMAYQTRLGIKTTGDVSKATGEYILELDRLASITGTTRKEQEEARMVIIKMNKVQSALLDAQQRGDKGEEARLKKVIEVAGVLYKQGNTKTAGELSEFYAAGGKATSAGTARIGGLVQGPGGFNDALSGNASITELLKLFTGAAIEREKQFAGVTKITGPNALTEDNIFALTETTKAFGKTAESFDEARKKDPNLKFDEFLDKQRKVTDSWRISQTELERQNRLAAQKLESDILGGRYDAMERALQGPANTMLDAAKKMLEASLNFLKGAVSSISEWWNSKDRSVGGQVDHENWNWVKGKFSGKSSKQYDTDEIGEIDAKMKTLNAMLKNPEEAKRIAENDLKLAKKEYDDKEKALTELNVAYNKEKDINKKREIEQKQILAMDAAEAARKKKNMAEQGVRDTDTGIFGYTGMARSADQSKLKDLEARKSFLTSSMAANSNSSNNKGDSGGFSTHSPTGGGDTKPKLKTVTSKSGPSAWVNEGVASNFQSLINHLDSIGYKIVNMGGYNDRDVRGKPGVKSAHAKGLALDINDKTNPMGSKLVTDMPENIGGIAGSNGLGWGGNWKDSKDSMHFSAAKNEGGTLMARTGGVFNGPPGGYPVELHGREAVVPLPNFEDKISVDRQSGASKTSLSNVVENNSSSNDVSMMIVNMFSMMETKLDDMIDKLAIENNYSDKLVKAMV